MYHLRAVCRVALLLLGLLALASSVSVALAAEAPVDDAAAMVAPAAPDPQIDDNIVLQITSPAPGARLRGRVEITGYAFDRRSGEGSGLNERDVRLYLNDAGDEWNLFDYALAQRDSPDAAQAYGARWDKVGFWDAWEACSFPEAPYKLIVWVSSRTVEGARQTASVDVYVERCPEATDIYRSNAANDTGGRYTLRVEGNGARSFSPDPIFGDYAAGIDAQCLAAGVSCMYGFDFRELPGPKDSRTNTYYRFYVDPGDSTFSLAYSPPGDAPLVTLVPWTAAPAILRGTAVNRVAVIVQGNWIRLFVNGQQVGEFRDREERRAWGQIGWMLEGHNSGPVEARFDNFLVSTPGPAERLNAIFPTGGGAPASPPNAGGSAGGGSAAGPSGRVLLRDDFSDPNSGWPRQSSNPSQRRVGYVNGEYVVAITANAGTGLASRSEQFTDFQAEIDARLAAPTTDAFLFLAFRGQENGDYYVFVVDPNDSTWWLARRTDNNATALINWTAAAAIQSGTARNRIGVRVQGADIVLLVNGQEVGRARDSTLRGGTLAFGVGNLENGPAEGYFGNLVVASIE